jgi:hypothetical protein
MKKLSLLFLLLIGVSSLLSAKIKYQGFTGGMRIHTGYLTTKNYTIADPDQNIIFSNKAQGFPFGMGGAARVQFGEHLRVGFEGYFSSLKQKNNGYISTGWGGALIDCVWHIKKWSPFVGTSIGGGSIKNLYLNADTNNDFTTDNNTIYDPDPTQALRNAKKQGALITHNHPGWRRKTCDMTEFEKQAYAEGLIDGVEIMNGASFYPTAMQRCVDQKLYMLGCTDIHGLTDSYRNSGVFRTMTFIFAKENTSKAIRKALEKGMTLAYCVGNIAGDAKLLQDFFKASVSCKLLYRSSKGKTTYALTNSTSIAYKIKFGKYNLEIPPFQTITLGVGKGKDGKEKDLAFYVTNMWEAGYKNPKIVYKAMAK